MTSYSDAELEGMLADIESDLAERKESLKGDAPTKARLKRYARSPTTWEIIGVPVSCSSAPMTTEHRLSWK